MEGGYTTSPFSGTGVKVIRVMKFLKVKSRNAGLCSGSTSAFEAEKVGLG